MGNLKASILFCRFVWRFQIIIVYLASLFDAKLCAILIKFNMFTLIQLPYAMEALEPVISAETISFHHGKHLQAYVDNLNKLLPGSGFEGLSLVDIVRQAPAGAIFNNAGQILNHEMYFTQFKPAENVTLGKGLSVMSQIEKQWGSFEAFKTEFESKGVGLFGSGWVWLSADADGSLVIKKKRTEENSTFPKSLSTHNGT